MTMNKAAHRRDVFDAMDEAAREYGSDLRRILTPEHAEATRASIVSRMRSDYLVKQYLAASSGRINGARIIEPWMALAEQRAMAMIVASDELDVEVEDGYLDDSNDLKRTRLAVALGLAQTFMWSANVFDTVKACPMPSHIVSRDILPFPWTYHTFEVAYSVVTPNGAPKPVPTDALTDWMLVADIPLDGGCSISMNVASREVKNTIKVISSGLRYGWRYPDDFPEYARAPICMFLSMMAFLKSPYTQVEERRLPRQWRRGETALSRSDAETTIHCVELRRAARAAVEAYEGESRSFKHRWWVSAHFRSQWHPSTQSHEVIWIAPYIKGPEGAPMLNKVYAVNR